VKPRVITHFEPWMALSFTEGSIGGDIERISVRDLQAFYGSGAASQAGDNDDDDRPRSPAAPTASRLRRATRCTITRSCGSIPTRRSISAPSCRW